MSIPTDTEHEEILRWHEERDRERRRAKNATTTDRIMSAMGKWAAEQGLLEKLDRFGASAEDARKAWETAKKLDAKQKKLEAAMLRSSAAYQSTLKANLE